MHAEICAPVTLQYTQHHPSKRNEMELEPMPSASAALCFKVPSLWDLMGFVCAGCRLFAMSAVP